MKRISIVLIVVAALAGLGYYFWQSNKNAIVKELILSNVSQQTDSLYYLRFDSSMIDEIKGEAYFENIYLQIDSTKQNSLKEKDSLPSVLVNVFVKSILVNGVDIPLTINEKKLHADFIIINEPHITIRNTGSKLFNREDTLALFQKILGDYTSIKTKRIEIKNAVFQSLNTKGEMNTEINEANVELNNVSVDSTKDYTNVISYFVQNMKADAKRIYINQPNKKSSILIEGVTYNAFEKLVQIKTIKTIEEGKNEERLRLNKLKLEEINVQKFVTEQTLEIGNVSTEGGTLTLFLNNKKDIKSNEKQQSNFDFPEDFFDEIKIGGLIIGKSVLVLRSKLEPNKTPMRVEGFTFDLTKSVNLTERKSLRQLVDNAKWQIGVDGFTLSTKDNKYKIAVNGIVINKEKLTASISKLSVKPTMTEEQFERSSPVQTDYYNIEMKTIQLTGFNINKFINESILLVDQASLNLDLKVYNDRRLPINPASKVGKYPHQLLTRLDMPIAIKKLKIENSYISYRERANETKQVGNLTFTNVQGTVNNVTNIQSIINKNPICVLQGSGNLLGKAACTTVWRLDLNAPNGKFEMDGEIKNMNFEDFNPLTKPLAVTTLSGRLNLLTFSIRGDDLSSTGKLTMLYNDLKLETFKLNSETKILERKKFKSKINNYFVKNSNPKDGVVRNSNLAYKRDLNKSFFNLVWKSVYDGVQNTILDKNIIKLKEQMGSKK